MSEFVFMGLFASFAFGVFICMIAIARAERKWLGAIVGIILSLAIGFGLTGALYTEQRQENEAWNNGYCECGGEFKLTAVTKTNIGGKTFYYTCKDCGHTIETSSLKK